MTLASRNTLLLLGIVFSLIVVGICAYVIAVIAASGFVPLQSDFVRTEQWLIVHWQSPTVNVFWVLGGTCVNVVTASVGGYLLRRYFLKTSAPEVFFFTVFTLSLCFEGVRSIELYFLYLNVPTLYGVILTRVVYFGYFLGGFCLLGSSLYAAGVQYPKYANPLGIAALVSFALAYVVPIDSLAPYPNLLFRIGNQATTQTISLVLGLLTILSYALAVMNGGTAERLPILFAVLMVLVGRDLLFYLSGPVGVISGGGLLAVGTTVYGIRNYRLYLWM